jgi:hypothetical protein
MACPKERRSAASSWRRRGVLRFVASAAALLGFGGLARAVVKLGMVDVDYQRFPKGEERCDNCRVWDPPDRCLSVEGEISPSGWCNIWRPQLKSQIARVDADGKLTQGDVAYQNRPKGDQRCSNCRVFTPPNACNSVQGRISPLGWCNIWRKA